MIDDIRRNTRFRRCRPGGEILTVRVHTTLLRAQALAEVVKALSYDWKGPHHARTRDLSAPRHCRCATLALYGFLCYQRWARMNYKDVACNSVPVRSPIIKLIYLALMRASLLIVLRWKSNN